MREFALPSIALLLVTAFAGGAGASGPTPPGFVDGTRLVDVLGDDNVRLEVTLGPTLLRPLLLADPTLQEVVGELESIYALIVDLSDPETARRAAAEAGAIEKRLVGEGWERVARVRSDGGERIQVLVRKADGDDAHLSGLTVIVIDASGDEPIFVFANITGLIDLGAIERLGDLDFPGITGLDLEP
ncbi:MAG TPA: DUF4252 domain-containing protein [Candidatus Polarisedimenticolaceae bacterium]|nr:DUF4252 domain-containing protein [Candidatus Polarisedimenticolaceae bacterium]